MVLSAWAAILRTTAGLGKWLEARQIFTSIAWKKKKKKKSCYSWKPKAFLTTGISYSSKFWLWRGHP